MTGIKGKSGGKREGFVKPKKYGEETVAMRVPVSLVPALLKKMASMKATASKKRNEAKPSPK
jgi:hypothetical protein